MATKQGHRRLESELANLLRDVFAGMKVTVEHSDRWDRPCATFVWDGFASLLAEERFQRLVAVIPEEFRNKRMKGFVWMELAPGETVDDALGSPRSEDVADREGEIYASLEVVAFFDALRRALEGDPLNNCRGDFSQTAAVLGKKNFSAQQIIDAKLMFIRRGAYCDCQSITTVRAELQRAHGDVV